MKKGLKNKTVNNILFVILILLFIILQGLTQYFSMKQYSIFNGVIMSFQYGVCLLLIFFCNKKGLVASLVMTSINLIMIIRAIIFSPAKISILPGFFNAIFYLITIYMVYRYNVKRETESITDILTGIYNRRGLYKYLNKKIENDEKFNIVCFTLDNFKVINDNYGHTYGDELLRTISKRLKGKIGSNGTIARIGGAEYLAVLNGNIDSYEEANDLLDIIRMKAEICVDSITSDCYLTSYAGIAAYPAHASDIEGLIKCADIAMCEASTYKSKTAYIFNDKMLTVMKRQIEVEKYIKDGLSKDLFRMVYQPQYFLEEKKLRGFEALLRLKTEDGLVVSPGEFIPVAEKGELILQIDDYVLRRSMMEFKPLIEKNKDITVSINVSAKNVGKIGFIDKITSMLKEIDFPPENLEIEITEYCMVDSLDITSDNITKLRELGIEIALDDFGTGYTSLNYVSKLPISLIKIDKSLIDDIVVDETRRAFAHTVIAMGHLMGCDVISEGVETEQQIAYLKEDGCDMVQGYVWGKPLEYDVATKLVTDL